MRVRHEAIVTYACNGWTGGAFGSPGALAVELSAYQALLSGSFDTRRRVRTDGIPLVLAMSFLI